ncbi:MAG: pyridoxal phosphate-dependent aminotransferase [Bryobacteraceae bacterium]|nr:pyridoxal phosphate-dependent aminotransferase [Bryobacteraceae bacterium]
MPNRTGPERIAHLKPSAVNSILAEMRELQKQGRNIVSLMRGEPDFPTPPHIVEAAVAALHNGRTGYPDNRGELKLRQAVSEKIERESGVVYDPHSEILITDGATLGVYAALMALVEEDDEVLLPDPVYDAYQSPIRLAGASAVRVRGELVGGRFHLPVEALDEAWTPDSRVLLLNTPWNPVGTVLTRAELERIGEFVLQRNLILISDEIYEHIVYDGASHVSPVALSPELRARTIVVNSFSKSYSMTGWRLGFVAAPKTLIQSMLLVLQQSSRGPATFVQDAGVAALAGPQDSVAEMLAAYAARRAQVGEALGRWAMLPEGGFFAMADIRAGGRSSDDIRRFLLEHHGVAVAQGSAYGAMGEGLLRVSFASGGDNLARGLQRLQAGLGAL